MKIKTTELAGSALDWAVAKILYEEIPTTITFESWYAGELDGNWGLNEEECSLLNNLKSFKPSSSWGDAGPIIAREGISVIRCDGVYEEDAQGFCNNVRSAVWGATTGEHPIEYEIVDKKIYLDHVIYGPNALISAMRCFVYCKLGHEVEVPEELA